MIKKGNDVHEERLSLTGGTWLTLISLVGSSVAANLILIYTMSLQVHQRVDQLDDKWQDRIIAISREFKEDLRRIEGKIPPDWFRAMVENNTKEINRLESEFTKDFVRRGELDQILKQHGNGDNQ